MQRAGASDAVHATLTLPFDVRQKARFKAQLDNGETVGLMLERGQILRGGDKLYAENGWVIEIIPAQEQVSTVVSEDSLLLSRICYHLGNRHVPLQIDVGWCRYQHDHVLDDLVRGLGGVVCCEEASFEPESGAYTSHAAHSHSH